MKNLSQCTFALDHMNTHKNKCKKIKLVIYTHTISEKGILIGTAVLDFNMIYQQNESYKSLHEAFVSNNTGTHPIELAVAVSPYPLASVCFQLLYIFDFMCNKSDIFMFFLEFICVMILQIFIFTFGADNCYKYYYALILFTIFMVALKIITGKMNGSKPWPSSILDDVWIMDPDNPVITAVANVRTHLCICVCICILAVDFSIFPRRFAKTEKYGYGLMDTGIGFFMLINGLVAPETKPKYQFSRGNTKALMKSLVSSVLLFLIGFMRIIFVKTLNYQEHVTEYGIGCSLVFLLFPPIYSGIIAIVMSVFYQVLLQLGLEDIIFNGFDGKDTRINIFDANREGLASCVSFTCLYLVGIQVGYIVFRMGVTLREWLRTILILFCLFLAITLTACLSHFYISPSSRRVVNVTYISWMSAFFVYLVVQWLAIDVVLVLLKYHSSREDAKQVTLKPSIINNVLSYNFLLAFLVANLLTGLVNLSVSTIYASDRDSFMILMFYMLAICLIAQRNCRDRQVNRPPKRADRQRNGQVSGFTDVPLSVCVYTKIADEIVGGFENDLALNDQCN
uniref:Phosphatidylinositol-glycan biosynthesis class W protein n=1 Tax=Strigamia maritima TaxID=126957 RepID=T1J7G5_STRMM